MSNQNNLATTTITPADVSKRETDGVIQKRVDARIASDLSRFEDKRKEAIKMGRYSCIIPMVSEETAELLKAAGYFLVIDRTSEEPRSLISWG